MPWGEDYPGRALVKIHLVELATHSWDIAFATGHTGVLDHNLGAATLACAEASIRPDYRNAEGNPFGPEVPVPTDATAWERLAAFMRRRPQGWAGGLVPRTAEVVRRVAVNAPPGRALGVSC